MSITSNDLAWFIVFRGLKLSYDESGATGPEIMHLFADHSQVHQCERPLLHYTYPFEAC